MSEVRYLLLISLLLNTLLGSSCRHLSNRVSTEKLNCGADADPSEKYVKILGPDGEELTSTDLRVLQFDSAGEQQALKPTLHGCVKQEPDKQVVVLAPKWKWGALGNLTGNSSRLLLRDISKWDPN